MARSHRATRPERWTALQPACLLVIYLGSSLNPMLRDGDWRASIAFALAGIGFVVTVLTQYAATWRTFTTDDADKLTLITRQVLVAYAVGWIVGAVWPATPGGAPLGVTIAGLGTALLAAEALRIYSRGTSNAGAAARAA